MSASPVQQILVACLALVGSFALAAPVPDDAFQEIPPPRPPHVQTPPPGSSWSLSVVYPPETVASSPEAPAVTIALLRTARLEVRVGTNQVSVGAVLDAQGHKDTYYVVKGHILEKARNTGAVFMLSKNRDADISSLVAASFPVVDWLNEKNYVGVEKFGSTAYYKYHQPPDPNLINTIFNGERTAWIRVSDGYPWKVQLDKMVFTFSEVTSFPSTIELPDEYRAVLDAKAAKERIIRLLSR